LRVKTYAVSVEEFGTCNNPSKTSEVRLCDRPAKPIELTLFSSIAKTEAREIKMTKLLIETESTPITVNFPSLVQMTNEQFYEFCQANGDLRIERTSSGEVIIMPPAFSDTGNRNFNIAAQLGYWTEQDGTGIGFDSSTGFTLPNGAMRCLRQAAARLRLMRLGLNWSDGTP
jgi:Putative restriction endonuclease